MGCLDFPTSRLGTNETIPHDVFDTMAVFTPKVAAQSQVLGIAVFAYAYVVTIPSWVNEKKAGVNINVTVWLPATVGLLMKIATGILGSWAFASLDPDDDQDIVKTMTRSYQPVLTQYVVPMPEPELLPSQTTAATPLWQLLPSLSGEALSSALPPPHKKKTKKLKLKLKLKNLQIKSNPNFLFSRYSAYLWDITTLIPGIPVLAVMVRYNLLSGNVCGRYMSFFWGESLLPA